MNADGASAFAASRRASLSGHVDRQQELILGLISCRRCVAALHIEATTAFGIQRRLHCTDVRITGARTATWATALHQDGFDQAGDVRKACPGMLPITD